MSHNSENNLNIEDAQYSTGEDELLEIQDNNTTDAQEEITDIINEYKDTEVNYNKPWRKIIKRKVIYDIGDGSNFQEPKK